MPLFLDACAFAKRYLNEGRSTQRVREITTGRRIQSWGGLVVSAIVEPEVISALAKHVRSQTFPAQRAQALREHPQTVQAFRNELGSRSVTIVELNRPLLTAAADLLRDNPRWEIGAGDALHLATALEVSRALEDGSTLVFVTTDRGLANAASAAGLPVFDPVYHGLEDMAKMLDR